MGQATGSARHRKILLLYFEIRGGLDTGLENAYNACRSAEVRGAEGRAIGSSGYAFDLRSPLNGTTLWQLEVQTDIPNAEITLSWPDFLSSAPPRYGFI